MSGSLSAKMFEVVDKRGQNHANPIPEKPITAEAALGGIERCWQEVEYLIVFLGVNNQQFVAGRAAGLRSDGCPFIADYILSSRWEVGFDWTKEAKKRLDTFLLCQCGELGACDYHQQILGTHEWEREGIIRLQQDGQRPAPRVLEILQKAERARQSRLVLPGR